jgi:hypothetical protein
MLLGFMLPLKRLLTQLEISLPTISLPTFPAKSLGYMHSSSACLILGSDPDAVGVHVALKGLGPQPQCIYNFIRSGQELGLRAYPYGAFDRVQACTLSSK